ncbi:hypothetical protein VHUM_02448 [Vanrija humicola]|uniref:DNA repair protein rhp7 treble clef domain-containing protein n=1 Tax=Vanrija humicola TaxID=5417 RepID=A0A7D8UYP4_VANHU|nr:hypothetical protein VHUM_02448 [Vanrija humicola]
MSGRRGRSGAAVRGPTSALTSFLGNQPDPQDNTNANTEAGPSRIEEEPEPLDSDDLDARPSKRRRALSIDSDDLDAESPSAGVSTAVSSSVNTPASTSRATSVATGNGSFMNCGECGKKFTVTQYTKEHPHRPQTWLCVPCCPKLGVNAFAKKKAPAKAAPKKAAREKIVHYEVTKGPTPLADLCIQMIGKYIEEVDALGDIGSVNMGKVCKIICKSRRLTPETATLLYSVDRTELTMYDCTLLVHESYLAMANLCPNLVTLNLQYCGQMQTETLEAWGKSLRHLRHLELYGPFLVRKEGWISFFKAVGTRLESLSITQSPRIDLETIEVLVKSCPNLRTLHLAEIGKLDSEFLIPLAKLKHLHSLEISSPGGTALSDDALDTFLQAVGANLTSLNLDFNPELSDPLLVSISQHCPKLTKLSLRDIDLSDAAVQSFFDARLKHRRPGFTHIDLEKGHDLAGHSLRALIKQSDETIESLSLLGWRNVDADAVSLLAGCKKLGKVDLSWCRNVTDFTVKDIIDGCPAIKEIRVWGCNRLTDNVPRKRGLKVVGIETHAL